MITLTPQQLTRLRRAMNIFDPHLAAAGFLYDMGIVLKMATNYEDVMNNKRYELHFKTARAEALFKLQYSEHL